MREAIYEVAERPGFFGRRKNEKIAELNRKYGFNNWELRHVLELPKEPKKLVDFYDFTRACTELYEESYYRHLYARPHIVDAICAFGEVYDNAETNVTSGYDYTRQESYSTHIQDIAIRNSLRRLGRWFQGSVLLQVRGPESEGFRLGLNPGQVPFFMPQMIIQPSLAPSWAGKGSVEDFWQSNKLCFVKMGGR